MHEVQDGAADHLLLGVVAEQLPARGVARRPRRPSLWMAIASGESSTRRAVPLLALAQGLLRAPAVGDVAEAPHPADGDAVEPLRRGVALEHAAVLELDHVERLRLRLGVELGHPLHEAVGLAHLLEDEVQGVAVVARAQHLGGDAPHLREPLVVRNDAAVAGDGEQAVSGGLQRGLHQGERAVQLRLRPLPLGDVVDDRVEQRLPARFHGAGVDLHLPHLARRQPMGHHEGASALRGALRERLRHLLRRPAVEVGEGAGGQVLARAAVEERGGGIGFQDASRPGIDEELDGAVGLEDLAVEVLAGRHERWPVAGRLAQAQAGPPRR